MSNTFQSGFSSLENEVLVEQLPVKGKIPPWLKGTLIRNGPVKFEAGKEEYRHWFDGLAMLHNFSFKNGEVSYANKFIKSQAYKEAIEKEKIGFSEFGSNPSRSRIGRLFSIFSPKITDNTNVNIARINNHFIAMTETMFQIEFDLQTLNTLGIFNYDDRQSGLFTTAHPHFDLLNNDVINYITRISLTSSYNIYNIASGTNSRNLISSLPVKVPAYMHSFGMSENFVVLAEFPLFINLLKLILGGKSFSKTLLWEPQKGTHFLVINKKDGKLAGRFKSEAFFAFHHVNAFERNGELIVDIVAYPDASIIDTFNLNILKSKSAAIPAGELRRYHIDLQGTNVSYEVLSKKPIEFPRINYSRFNTKDYSFVYGVGSYGDFFNKLIKVDVYTGVSKDWFEEDCYPGEPVFVPSPQAAKEDDGVILSIVFDSRNNNSFLLLQDADSFEEMARATVPHHIPFGFHGQYFDSSLNEG